MALPVANVPRRSFGPCRSARMPIGRSCFFSMARIARTKVRKPSCEVWLILMRKTSAPSMKSRSIVPGSEEAGPSVATILVRRCRLIGSGAPCRGWRRDRRGLSLFGELNGPVFLLAGIDFEETGAIEAARETIRDAFDGELFFARAHEGLACPFAALIVIKRIDIIKACDKRSAHQRLASVRCHVPPALGGPDVVVLVADGDADAALRAVAETKIGMRNRGAASAVRKSARRAIRTLCRIG